MALVWRYLPSVALDETTGEEYWCIREVYQGTGPDKNPDPDDPFGGLSWVQSPMRPLGETYDDLGRDVQFFLESFISREYLDLRDPDAPRIGKFGDADG